MATIVIPVSDPRHSEHGDAIEYLDNHGNADWDDLDEIYAEEEIEVDDDE